MVPDRSHIQTERRNPASETLDRMSILEAVELMNREDAAVVEAVGRVKEEIATAVAWVAESFHSGGRLAYFGAGTSGRLGVLDASECPPTFCSDPSMVVGIIAGGDAALRKSIENVEDDPEAGAQHVRELAMGPKDVAFGIAAGGTTPFVYGALAEARRRGAKTVFLICTDPAHVRRPEGESWPDLFIAVRTGAEILTGSTRLKAGTATKMVLNMVTTLAMVQIGKTLGNLMIDVDSLKNRKLVDRGIRMIGQVTGLERGAALRLLDAAGGKVKRAIVMQQRGCGREEADRLLAAAGGKVRSVLEGEM